MQAFAYIIASLHWRHNDHGGVSNHQPHNCLLNRLFRRRSKKTSRLRVTGLCAGNSPGPVNSPHKWPVTRKMFPFDDVIMFIRNDTAEQTASVNGQRYHEYHVTYRSTSRIEMSGGLGRSNYSIPPLAVIRVTLIGPHQDFNCMCRFETGHSSQ